MSTSADIRRKKPQSAPIYQRKRRRIYGGLTVVALAVTGLIVWIVTAGTSAAPVPDFTVAYGQGAVANSDSIIASVAALAKTIPAHLNFVPFDAAATAIPEMPAGSLPAISVV